jgi:hypothetical protein
MPPKVFTLSEAQALQGHLLRATKDYQDEHGRTLIPHTGMCHVIGLDVWDAYDAGIAVQYNAGEFPKVVLMNKTTYHEYFENRSLQPVAAV